MVRAVLLPRATAKNSFALLVIKPGIGPFPDVASDIDTAVGAITLGRELADRGGVADLSFVGVAEIGLPLVTPRVETAIGATGCFFPLSFVGDAFTRPVGVSDDIGPRDVGDGMPFFADGAVGDALVLIDATAPIWWCGMLGVGFEEAGVFHIGNGGEVDPEAIEIANDLIGAVGKIASGNEHHFFVILGPSADLVDIGFHEGCGLGADVGGVLGLGAGLVEDEAEAGGVVVAFGDESIAGSGAAIAGAIVPGATTNGIEI